MRELVCLEYFEVGKVKYRFSVTKEGSVSFSCVGGKNHNLYDPFNWFDECETYEDVGQASNPVAVFRKVGELLINYVYTKEPAYFKFEASTTKKAKLYKRIGKKLDKMLPDYNYCYDKGNHYFYRTV
jgi:hypothetical protein